MALLISATSNGSTKVVMATPASGKEETLEVMTGQALWMASMTGMPNPS